MNRILLLIFLMISLSSHGKPGGPFYVSTEVKSLGRKAKVELIAHFSDSDTNLKIENVRNENLDPKMCFTLNQSSVWLKPRFAKKLQDLKGSVEFKLRRQKSSCRAVFDIVSESKDGRQSVTKTVELTPVQPWQ